MATKTARLLAVSALAVAVTLASGDALRAQPDGGVPTAGSAAERITIVSSLPHTGADATEATAIDNGIRLCLEAADFRAGRFTLAYESWDDGVAPPGRWTAPREAANADRAREDANVMVYLGPFHSGAARVSMPILNRAGVAMISPANTYPGLTKPGFGGLGEPDDYRPTGRPNYARVAPSDEVQGAAAARWLQQRGVRSVYLLGDGGQYGELLASAFRDAAQGLGLTVLRSAERRSAASGFGPLVETIAAAAPEAVYIGAIAENSAGLLVRALRETLGDGVVLIGPNGLLDERLLRDAGAAAEGMYLTNSQVDIGLLGANGQEWHARYQARWGREPTAYAPYGYDACRLALDAIARADRADRVAIRDAVFATRDFPSLFGPFSIDANGDTTLTLMSMYQVRDGRFTPVEVIDAAP